LKKVRTPPSFGIRLQPCEVSRAELEDILWCHFHKTGPRNWEAVLPRPRLFWHKGWVICTCESQGFLDQEGFGYICALPFLCIAPLQNYQRELKVPGSKPEVSVPLIKALPRIFREVFDDIVLANVRKEEVEGK